MNFKCCLFTVFLLFQVIYGQDGNSEERIEISDCQPSKKCQKVSGKCVRNYDCEKTGSVKCVAQWCEGPKCTCKYDTEAVCSRSKSCSDRNGACVHQDDCVESETEKCRIDLCYGSTCTCRYTKFYACPVDDVASIDYSSVDLNKWRVEWNSHLQEVPSLTEECKKDGKTVGCQRGSIDWTSAGPKRLLIDTDFVNEVDDFFAVAWALLSSVGTSPQVTVTAIVAAPFSFRPLFLPLLRAQELLDDEKSNGGQTLTTVQKEYLDGQMASLIRLKDVGITPKLMIERDNHATWCPSRGMEQSYLGLKRFVKLFGEAGFAGICPAFKNIKDTPIKRGQTKYLSGTNLDNLDSLIESEGVAEIIRQAKASSIEDPLYVSCIATPTNVATALLLAPEIVGKIIVLWDASWGLENRGRVVTSSLNLSEDYVATRILFESGVRMLYFTAFASGQTLQLSAPEVNAWYKGQGPVSDALFQRYNNNPDRLFSGLGFGRYHNAGTTRIMWDVGNFIPFILPDLLSVRAVPSPRLEKVKTVLSDDGSSSCNGYESLGTTCMAYYPNDDTSGNTYMCNAINPYNKTQCIDGFFVDAQEEEYPRLLVETELISGLSGPGGSGIDLLHKLQAAGL